MTDNEIIKVMESSKECCDDDVNVFEFLNEVIDLINRQKAEIEKLKTDLEFKCDNCENIRLTRKEYKKIILQIKSETIKDFWERVKSKYERGNGQYIDWLLNEIINDLVKEMAEEAEE